jgi:hypothetical protein
MEDTTIFLKEALRSLINGNCLRFYYPDGRFKGQGFCASRKIFTAHHVVEDEWLLNSREHKAFQQYGDKDISYADNNKKAGFSISNTCEDGQPVYIIGIDDQGKEYIIPATLESMGPIHRGKMQLNIDRTTADELDQGTSGSAVIDQKLEVVGVLCLARLGGKGMMEPIAGLVER